MSGPDPQTDRVRALYDDVAPRYDRAVGLVERLLFGGGRASVCAQAVGNVLEVAVGTGRNLSFYPPAVRLTGIDISPAMLDIARAHATLIGVAADLRLGDAQALDFPDASFDTVVITLGLCTIPNDARALAEARRVLRLDGLLLLLEHVRSPLRAVRLIQLVLDPIAVRLLGDHLAREPLDTLAEHGFVVEKLIRSKWGIVEQVRARRS